MSPVTHTGTDTYSLHKTSSIQPPDITVLLRPRSLVAAVSGKDWTQRFARPHRVTESVIG